MAQETLGVINLEWVCPNCGTKNPGPQKTCSGCGSPQPENVVFQQPEHAELITDETEIKKADEGADIHCGFCGARNPVTNTQCSQCGGDLKEGKQRQSGQVLGAYQSKPVSQVKCPACGALNPESNGRCQNCGSPLKPVQREPLPAAQPATGKKFLPLLLVIPIILGIICVIFIALSLLRTESLVGTVQSVAWMRSIVIEKYGDVTREAWKEDIPSSAKLGTCELKYHHTQNDPAPNSEKVCGTPYTIDSGTGKGKVVQDCQYKVSKDFCKYTVQEWQKVDEAVARGTDFKPIWPEPKLTTGQRLGQKDELYTVNFSADKANYKYLLKDATEFTKFSLGSKWQLEVNALNQITSVKPNP